MSYYQGMSSYHQVPHQRNQGYSVIYAEPVIHEPITQPNKNNFNGYHPTVAYRTFQNYNHYPSFDNRTTLNPNMFQPVIPGMDQLNLQYFNQVNHQAQTQAENQPAPYENKTAEKPQQVAKEETIQATSVNSTVYGNTQNQHPTHAMYNNYPYPPHGVNTQNNQPVNNQTPPVDPYFINPLQHQANVNHPMYNPYPKMKILPKQQTTSNSILSSFKDPDGKYDIVSVVNTAGQMVNVVNQVGSIFKGIGGIFKV